MGYRILFLTLILTLTLIPPSFAGVRIEGAEIEWHKYYDNVFINTSDYISPKVKAYPDRIVLTFNNAKAEKFRESLAKSPRIRVIRSESAGPDTARVIIELKRNAKHETATLFGKNQVLIEVAEAGDPMPYHVLMPPPDEDPAKPQWKKRYTQVKGETISVKVAEPLKSEEKKPARSLKGKIIVVDPGHGGQDPGALSYDKTAEKELTLKTAVYLAKYLQGAGATVFLTRKTDTRKDLKDIAAFANRIGADIYIAVHYNSLDKPMSGIETYYYSPQSFRLAQLIHKRMTVSLKREDRGVKRARFYTIAHANMPAILVEPAYITDMQEGILAKAPTFQKEVARSIAKGVKDYYLR